MGKAEMEVRAKEIRFSVRIHRNRKRKMQILRDRTKGMDQKKFGADALAASLYGAAGGQLIQPIGGQGQAVGTVRNGINIGIENTQHALPLLSRS